MKSLIIRLIGIFAIHIGAIDFVFLTMRAVHSPESISLAFILTTLATCILIYAGYRTIQQKAVGRKLLLIFFAYKFIELGWFALLILISYFVTLSNQIGKVEFNLQPFLLPVSQEYLAWFYLFCLFYYVLSTIAFFRKSIIESLVAEKNQDADPIAKILPWSNPNWRQALVDNYRVGMVLFLIVYILLADNTYSIKVNGTQLYPENLFFNNVIKLCLLAFFALLDWVFGLNTAKKRAKQTVSNHEDSHPDA